MYVHGGGGAAACEIANVCPSTVMAPLRAAPLFDATLKPTVPVPLPEPPLVMLIHDALGDAVHAHQLPVVETAKLPVPPPLSID